MVLCDALVRLAENEKVRPPESSRSFFEKLRETLGV
jgi:ribosomal 50S subunit-associated protein YjgA (DUF615 family)